jgi:hypothetical protein
VQFLNADQFDSLDSTAFANAAGATNSGPATVTQGSAATAIQVPVVVKGKAQWVAVHATFTPAYPSAAGASVLAYIQEIGGSTGQPHWTVLDSTSDYETMSVSALFPAAPGTHTYALRVVYEGTASTNTLSAYNATIIATSHLYYASATGVASVSGQAWRPSARGTSGPPK